jgi:hypothetical protein
MLLEELPRRTGEASAAAVTTVSVTSMTKPPCILNAASAMALRCAKIDEVQVDHRRGRAGRLGAGGDLQSEHAAQACAQEDWDDRDGQVAYEPSG